MLRWFARNDIAANFLMIAVLLLGIHAAFFRIPLEVQPGFELQEVRVDIPFRGGNPKDVEQYVVIPVERALQGLSGVTRIESEARRDSGTITIEAQDGVDLRELLDEVESRVNGINTFPSETENPRFRIPNSEAWFEVISVAVTGDLGESDLLKFTQQVRDELLELPGVSLTEIVGERQLEISIEADDRKLRDHNLSLADIGNAIRNSSLSLSAGTISTDAGGIMLRTDGQAYTREEFENIPLSAENGARLRLGDVATVIEGFEEDRKLIRFNQKPALLIEVMRTGDENALKISQAVKDYAKKANERFPDGIRIETWDDESLRIKNRLGTLGSSLAFGAFLVLLVLGLFLRPSVAFWVVLGIPVSFAGGVLLMPVFGVTANLMSVFGFIIVLGIVVDDAIVTAENIFTKMKEGLPPLDAAVDGTKEIATPVTFGILTTIVAFIPMLFFEGFWGNFTKQIPPVVSAVLIFSLVESKLVLPSHLKHIHVNRDSGQLGFFARFQKGIADGLESLIERWYRPLLDIATRHRYTTLIVFFGLALLAAGLWKGDKLGFVAMPEIESNKISARLEMADDTPWEETDARVLKITAELEKLREELRDPGNGKPLITHIMTATGGGIRWGRGARQEEGWITAEILPEEERSEPGLSNEAIAELWREAVGPMKDVRRFQIFTERGGGRRGMDEVESVEIQIRGDDSPEREELLTEVKSILRAQSGIVSVWDNARNDNDEYSITLKPRATELGLTQRNLANQIRSAFFGEQAQRLQRGRDEIRVMVRLPEKMRESTHTLDTLSIRANDGTVIPLSSVATLTLQKAPGRINRINGAQTVEIGAQPEDKEVDIIRLSEIVAPQLDELFNKHPEITWVWEGFLAEHEEQKRREMISWGALLIALYALLAIPFRSLLQPIFVLLAIPFGIIGALLGHLIMDVTPSALSTFGMMALAGVVVNDSLVLVDFINQKRNAGTPLHEAVLSAGVRRFRPILLTSLTTFVGLVPLMFDQSRQAAFLVPMAISLGWGILFATFITLILIPASYLAFEDLARFGRKLTSWYFKPFKK
ncbi:MAG: efflux RND transporter permease subunit [Verrucomicrobiales bacterium]